MILLQQVMLLSVVLPMSWTKNHNRFINLWSYTTHTCTCVAYKYLKFLTFTSKHLISSKKSPD